MGTTTTRTIEIKNIGLLACDFELEMKQVARNQASNFASHFYIQNSGLGGVYSGLLGAKKSVFVTVVYDLTQHVKQVKKAVEVTEMNATNAMAEVAEVAEVDDVDDDQEFKGVVVLRWSKVKGGPFVIDETLGVQGGVGVVDVRLAKPSVDFGTMFVKQWKTKRVTVTNHGNTTTDVTCVMHSAYNEDGGSFLVRLSPTKPETLEPGETMTLEIRIQSKTVELLQTSAILHIEGGDSLELSLIGIVAAPHLDVPSLELDYGVLRANTSKQTYLDIQNSGNFVVSYDMLLLEGIDDTDREKNKYNSKNRKNRKNGNNSGDNSGGGGGGTEEEEEEEEGRNI